MNVATLCSDFSELGVKMLDVSLNITIATRRMIQHSGNQSEVAICIEKKEILNSY